LLIFEETSLFDFPLSPKTAPVSWKIEPQDTKTSVGQRIDIKCEAEGIPEPTVIVSKKASSSSVLSEVSRGTKSVVLGIDSVSYNDSGSYSCQAWNQGSSKISKDFVIHVSGQFGVRFELFPELKEGNSV
jgi:hypothetical protein